MSEHMIVCQDMFGRRISRCECVFACKIKCSEFLWRKNEIVSAICHRCVLLPYIFFCRINFKNNFENAYQKPVCEKSVHNWPLFGPFGGSWVGWGGGKRPITWTIQRAVYPPTKQKISFHWLKSPRTHIILQTLMFPLFFLYLPIIF